MEAELAEAQEESRQTSKPARRLKDFTWSTIKSRNRGGTSSPRPSGPKREAHPRFIVTSLDTAEGRRLYEDIHRARGARRIRVPAEEF